MNKLKIGKKRTTYIVRKVCSSFRKTKIKEVTVMADMGFSVSIDHYSLTDIRKQAAEIKKRVGKQEEALKSEIERTGMIENGKGEMVPLSSLSDVEKRNLVERACSKLISPTEAAILFKDADPNAEEIEADKARAAKFRPIQNKMFAGKKLTGQEMNFLREYYPEFATTAERAEAEAKALEQKLNACKNHTDAQRVFSEAKTQIMSGASKKDGSILFLSAALDEAYSKYMKRGVSGITMDFLA